MSTLNEVLTAAWEEPGANRELYHPLDGYPIYRQYSDAVCVSIEDKKISDFAGQTSVSGESGSQYIEFMMPRFYDGIDLVGKLLQIHYEWQDGTGSEDSPVNARADDSYIKFGWIVPEQAVRYPGTIYTAISVIGMEDGNAYVWKTDPKEYVVNRGLELGGGIPEPDDSWYEQFIFRMNEKIAGAIDEIRDGITMPVATREIVGGVKVGDGLGIQPDGNLYTDVVVEPITNKQIDDIFNW